MNAAFGGDVTDTVRKQWADDGRARICDLPGDQSVTLFGTLTSVLPGPYRALLLTCSLRRHQV
jgi:hypothetical protein